MQMRISLNRQLRQAVIDKLQSPLRRGDRRLSNLDEVAAKQQVWMEQTWPEILRLAQSKKALLLFGDEASFAQWGSLSYTWSRRGVQPTVKTSGQRKAYKVFGLIDYFP